LEDNFKDAYNTYIHLKTLRAIIDSTMRFGSSESFFLASIEIQAGKEKKFLQDLTAMVGEANTKGMYGNKEEIEDTEDFYPFAHVPINIP
jgi:V-type H+-transporting ATPase subunit C